jgi:hypothetical protein
MRDVAGGFRKAELYFAIAALLGTLACTGVVDGSNPGGSNPAAGGSPTDPGPNPSGIPVNPGRSEMHRLNSNEYNATVADVLGTALKPASLSWRGGEIDGFDNMAAVLGVDETQYGLYLDAAETLANDVFMNAASKAKFVTCAKTDDMACVQDVISKGGLRIFRRPLRPGEITTYQKVYTAARMNGQDHDGSLKTVLWSLLSSAEFLYRMELPGKTAGKRALDGFELASRLSYFLWSSAPDDAMLTAAANNGLSKDADLQATVERMLTDVKSSRFVEAFAGQWLGARKVAGHAVSPDRFPIWTPAVADAAQNEMYQYFSEFLQKDRPWTEFLTADVNFVNAALAPVYGMANVSGTALMRVENTTDQRKGFMGLAGFLSLSSMDRRTSPTLRGKWVLGNLLCTEAPPPPADIPKLEIGGKDLDNGNIREILQAHRTRADCAACHAMFDPFGFALEKYDAIGKFRTTYGDGSAIDDSTDLAGVPFAGIDGAADIVSKKPEFKSCLPHRLYEFSLGRKPANDDSLWIKDIDTKWEQSNLTLRQLITDLALSVPFRNSGDVK